MSFASNSAQSTQDPMFSAPKSLQSERFVPAMDGKLESRLTIRDLERLHKSFMVEGDGYHGNLSLTKDQFCEALSMLLKKGTVEEYAKLFDKIDVTKEGSVDWDSLASYLLLEYYEKDDRTRSSQVPQWKDIKILASPHKETIQRVSFLKNTNRYIAVSKEGCISWWSTDLKLQWSLKTGTDTIKMKDLWVTHCVPFQNINKMALAFTSKEIGIYDLNSKNEINIQYKIQGLHFTPLCLDYWYNPDNANEAVLVWGDVGGFINIIFFNSANIALFERPPAPAHEKQEPCLNVQLKDIISGRYKNVTHAQYDAHVENNKGEWVRKAALLLPPISVCLLADMDGCDEEFSLTYDDISILDYIPESSLSLLAEILYSHHLECFISCAATNTSSVVIGWMEKHASVSQSGQEQPMKRQIQRKFEFNVPQGVIDFDFNGKLNLIATAGANNHICLWNPYVISKPNGILKGHMASVVQVQFVPARNQLLSFSKDKIFRIWDVQLQVCIQRLAGMFPKGHVEAVSYLFFDDGKDRDGRERNKLFLTFNHQITAMDMKTEVKDRIVSHERPVMAAIYNSLYNQVVSVCQIGTIIMWLIDTGQKVKQFSKAHGSSEVTCLTQDQSETRLFTGSTDGTVKIWDFNGHCYHSLECAGGQPADIGQILVLKRCVVVVGWTRCITVFRNNAFKEFHVKPSEWKGGQEHAEDILSCAFMSPNTLATGSYDGEIVVWNTNSEHASRHCAHRSRRSLKSRGQNFTPFSVKESSTSSGSKRVLDDNRNRLSELSRNNLKRSAKSRSGTSLSLKTTDEQGDFGWAVVRLIFLENRRNIAAASCANLVSCGDRGWVRFWNTAQCTLAAEYVAHENVGSIIMATDQSNHFIVTADAEGFVRVWDIQEYAISPVGQPITNPPLLMSQFQPHDDQINSLEILERNGRLLIISASSDCTVALWDIIGIKIGIFGQEEHWKVEPYQNLQEMKTERIQQEEEDRTSVTPSIEMSEDSQWEPCIEAITEPHKYRVNSWDKTELGKQYQRLRIQKRERKQPSTIPDLPYLQWEKTGALLAGPYSALQTQELKPVQQLIKPDTERYFDKRLQSGQLFQAKLPALADTLTTSFDEKSMFPSYILEFEKKMKNYHIALLNQSQSKSKNEPSAVQNFASQNGQMGATVPVFTHRNTSSRGPAGLKVQPASGVRKSSASTTATFTAD